MLAVHFLLVTFILLGSFLVFLFKDAEGRYSFRFRKGIVIFASF